MTKDVDGNDIPPPPLLPHRSPECPASHAVCRIEISAYPREPVIAWTPTYRDGWPIDSDPNTMITDFSCSECGDVWQTTTEPGGKPEVSMFKQGTIRRWRASRPTEGKVV